ncbi:hypothetical protein RYX36_029963 [Vicia faba]
MMNGARNGRDSLYGSINHHRRTNTFNNHPNGVSTNNNHDDNTLDLFSNNRRSLSLPSSDDSSDVSVKLGRLSVGGAKPARNGIEDMMASVEGGKHDYDWSRPGVNTLKGNTSETQASVNMPRRASSPIVSRGRSTEPVSKSRGFANGNGHHADVPEPRKVSHAPESQYNRGSSAPPTSIEANGNILNKNNGSHFDVVNGINRNMIKGREIDERQYSAKLSEIDVYESSRYDALLLKEDLKNTNWLHSVDDKFDQGSLLFDNGFENLPEPFGRSRPGVNTLKGNTSETQASVNMQRRASSPIVSRGRSTEPVSKSRGFANGNGHHADVHEPRKVSHAPEVAARRSVKASTNTTDNSGFGRNISKKSLDMAIKHMVCILYFVAESYFVKMYASSKFVLSRKPNLHALFCLTGHKEWFGK